MATSKSKTSSSADKPKKSANSALGRPVTPDDKLAAVVGAAPLPRTELTSKIWEYIRNHSLQNPANKREIVADSKLQSVFGQAKASMFEMNKLISKHLT